MDAGKALPTVEQWSYCVYIVTCDTTLDDTAPRSYYHTSWYSRRFSIADCRALSSITVEGLCRAE